MLFPRLGLGQHSGTVCVGVPQHCGVVLAEGCQQLALRVPVKNGTMGSTAASRARLGNIRLYYLSQCCHYSSARRQLLGSYPWQGRKSSKSPSLF